MVEQEVPLRNIEVEEINIGGFYVTEALLVSYT